MAKKKPPARKKAAGRPARKTSSRKKTAVKKPSPRTKPAVKKKARAAKPPARKARTAAQQMKPVVREGIITHTELASADPPATKEWCASVLGWKFVQAVPTPSGPYHMWDFGNRTGGGIRSNNPPEMPGSIPYCEVKDIRATFDRAVMAGATVVMPPEQIPGGMGWIAIVMVPGGVVFGFWSPG